jgi:hypothetical protein
VVSITWDFTIAKTVAQRFESAVVGGEAVTWTVNYGGSSRVLSGTWRFSSTAGSMLSRFGGQGSSFSSDDGLWGAGTGIVNGDSDGIIHGDFWGHGNTDGGDSLCATVYLGSSSSTQSALVNRMYVLAILPPPPSPPSPPPPPYSPGECPCDHVTVCMCTSGYALARTFTVAFTSHLRLLGPLPCPALFCVGQA